MAQKFIFTCVAASYTLPGGGQYFKGQTIELVEGDPRMHLLRGNAAWDVKAGPIEAPPPPVKPAGDASELVELFGTPIAKALVAAGFHSRDDLRDKTEAELLAIKGIGTASAKVILSECEFDVE